MIYNVDMFFVALYLAKLSGWLIEKLKLGTGYTWPGHLALKVHRDILYNSRLHFPKGIVMVSGTNGKTTTTKILTHLLNLSGLKSVHNSTGANLLNGITSQILLSMNFAGRLDADIGVFEVDEFALPEVMRYLKADILILLNLSRDQLDRYGETDTILEKWREAVLELDSLQYLILDRDQEDFSVIASEFKGKVILFGDQPSYVEKTGLTGNFNSRNINACLETGAILGLKKEDMLKSLGSFQAAYGRGETIEYKGVNFQVLLAKNPASFNHNLNALNNLPGLSSGDFSADTPEIPSVSGIPVASNLLFVLNDNIPDGRDVSWIYDIESVSLAQFCRGKRVFVSGSRALDMAIRLGYAGVIVEEPDINPVLAEAVDYVADNLEDGNSDLISVLVLPNYSAMLEIRKCLLGRRIL